MPRDDHKLRARVAFDRQAREYDRAAFGRHARRLHGEVMAAVETFTFDAVLDVGCGTGATLAAIVAAHAGVRAWGVDLSPEMVAVARERLCNAALSPSASYPERDVASISIDVADAEQLPLPDDSVDLVVCVDSFHHYPNPEAALREMHRVTRRGGGLVFGEWSLRTPWRQLMNSLLRRLPAVDVRIYTAGELTDLVEAAGYSVSYCRSAGVRGQILAARR